MAFVQRCKEGLDIEVTLASGEKLRVFIIKNDGKNGNGKNRPRLAVGIEAGGARIRVKKYGASKPASKPLPLPLPVPVPLSLSVLPVAGPSPLGSRRLGPPVQRRERGE